MRWLCEEVIETALGVGASFADVRISSSWLRRCAITPGGQEILAESRRHGALIRVAADGVGTVAVQTLDAESLTDAATRAVELARTAALVGNAVSPTTFAPADYSFVSDVAIDPESMTPDTAMNDLRAIDDALHAAADNATTSVWADARKDETHYGASDGVFSTARHTFCGGGTRVALGWDDRVQTRTGPIAFGGHHIQGGWEVVTGMQLREGAATLVGEASRQLVAGDCPNGEMDVLLDADCIAAILHRTAVELFVSGRAGALGEGFGSSLVTIVADTRQVGGLATAFCDAEGLPSDEWDLVTDGVVSGRVGGRFSRVQTTGGMQSGTWSEPPIALPNISLCPRDAGSLEDLVGSTTDGLLMMGPSEIAIDETGTHLRLGAELGWLVRNGALGDPVFRPTMEASIADLWAACDAVCGPTEYRVYGLADHRLGPARGSSHGAAPARFTGIRVGTGYDA